MGLPVKRQDRKYTYADYLTWPDDERWEIIEGVAYDMSPAPNVEHQRILRKLFYQFEDYLKDKTCEVFVSPFDVILLTPSEKDEEIDTVVQPDIVIVCDKSKLDDKGCKGTPDLIIEITSPSTAKKDLKEKLFLYEKSGVKEYWTVHPTDKTVMVFKLGENKEYGRPEIYGEEDKINVGIFELKIGLEMVFKTI